MTPSGEISVFVILQKRKFSAEKKSFETCVSDWTYPFAIKSELKDFLTIGLAKPYSRKRKQKYLNQRILTRQVISLAWDPRIVVHVDSMITGRRRRGLEIKQNHRLSCWTLQYQTRAEDCSRLCALARNIAFSEQRALVLLWSLVNVRVHLFLIGQSSFVGLWNRMANEESEHILTINKQSRTSIRISSKSSNYGNWRRGREKLWNLNFMVAKQKKIEWCWQTVNSFKANTREDRTLKCIF